MTQQLQALRSAEPVLPPSLVARRGEPAAGSVAATPAAASEPVLPNPQLRLDAALGLVVLEFRDLGGQSRTIPTERELDAYRSSARSAAPAEETGRRRGVAAAPAQAAAQAAEPPQPAAAARAIPAGDDSAA